LRKVGAIEKAISALERFEQEIRLLKQELSAYLPNESAGAKNFITHPVTGEKIFIKRKGK